MAGIGYVYGDTGGHLSVLRRYGRVFYGPIISLFDDILNYFFFGNKNN
jgi:hypothetical protein